MSVFVSFVFFLISSGVRSENVENPKLFLTVSSLFREAARGSVFIDREIQVNYESNTFDTISLFKHDPVDSTAQPIFEFDPNEYPGFIETNVTLGNPKFPHGWDFEAADFGKGKRLPEPGEHCLPVWVTGSVNDTVTDTNCIRIRPTWMQDNRHSIGGIPLSQLFIPGTHNSGSYKRGESLSRRDTAGRYLLNQDQTVWAQLVYGIRYFDFRIGFYPVKSNSTSAIENSFWINHDLIKVRPLHPIVKEIKEFLWRTTDEILIIDFHRFPIGFSRRIARHMSFITYLQKEFGDFVIPYHPVQRSLDQIWATGKRLIISYGDSSISRGFVWLWPPVRQLWGNKQKLGPLHDFLTDVVKNASHKNPSQGLYAAMAQLTPGPLDLILNPKGSLREMAHIVNRNLTKWVRRQNWSPYLNIVAADFFLETDIISAAVATNVAKGECHKKYSIDSE